MHGGWEERKLWLKTLGATSATGSETNGAGFTESGGHGGSAGPRHRTGASDFFETMLFVRKKSWTANEQTVFHCALVFEWVDKVN